MSIKLLLWVGSFYGVHFERIGEVNYHVKRLNQIKQISNKMLAACSTDLKLQNYTTGTLQSSYQSLYSPEQPIVNISWSSDDSQICLLPKNGNAEILDAKEARFKTSIPIIQSTAATFQRTKENIAIGTVTGKLILYDVSRSIIIPSDHEVLMPVTYLDFNSSDTQMAVGGRCEKIVLFSKFKLSSCMLLAKGTRLTAMRFHREFNQLAAGGDVGVINIWDTQEGDMVFNTTAAHTSAVTDLTFVPTLSILVSVSKDHRCVMHDLRNRKPTIFSFAMPSSLTSLDFAPSRDYNFALATELGEIYSYDLRKMCSPISCCRQHGSRINSVRFASQYSTSCATEERLIVDDGDRAGSQRSVVELYKAGEGKFMKPEESLCGIYGTSLTGFKPETSGLDGKIASKMNVICDAKQFKQELLQEVKGIVGKLQDEVKTYVADLKNYCTEEFIVLEKMIDIKCDATRTGFETNEQKQSSELSKKNSSK